MRTHNSGKTGISLLLALGLLAGVFGQIALGTANAQVPGGVYPVDCEGAAPDAEPGTAEWFVRDANNIFCAQQRHLDKALHPVTALPTDGPPYDAYRAPSRHDGTRFRFQSMTIAGQPTEVYRPCAEGTCTDLPSELQTHEPPYPVVISLHGGASRKELHWWSSQPLAEAGYFVVSYDGSGAVQSPSISLTQAMLDWLHSDENPFAGDIDTTRIGLAGHSAGGVVANGMGHTDERIGAIVAWDRAQSSQLNPDIAHRTPSLFFMADWNCQQVPVCQPEPYRDPPNQQGPGNKGNDFEILRNAGVDAMKIALRAVTHLDWVPSELSGNRYGEPINMYYTLAWFDRYLKGRDDPAIAQDAFQRLTADVYDDSADRHNISQGFWNPAQAALSGDPLYGGNVPYTLEGQTIRDRLSFYFLSKCFLTPPGGSERVGSDDVRGEGCA